MKKKQIPGTKQSQQGLIPDNEMNDYNTNVFASQQSKMSSSGQPTKVSAPNTIKPMNKGLYVT